MSYNGSGVFVRLYNWVTDAAAVTPISSTKMDAEFDGVATGLTNCVTKDGQTTITANLPMSGFKHTGVANASASNEYAAFGQIATSIAATNITDLNDATITSAAAGDFLTHNGTVWVNKKHLYRKGTSIASATTTDIGAADSDFIDVTGTTTITGLGSTDTRNHVWVNFTGALTLTHNGTSLILPTAANITTANGDVAEFVRISGSNWKCVNYTLASGAPITGSVIFASMNSSNVATSADIIAGTASKFVTAAGLVSHLGAVSFVKSQYTGVNSGSTTTPYDDSIPQVGEGNEFMSVTITPKSSTSVLVIDICVAAYASSTNNNITGALFRDGASDAIAAWDMTETSTGVSPNGGMFRHILTAGSTSATTFTFRMGVGTAGTVTFNGRAGSRLYGGVAGSSISVTEYKS